MTDSQSNKSEATVGSQSLVKDENFFVGAEVADALKGLLRSLERRGNIDTRLLSAVWVDVYPPDKKVEVLGQVLEMLVKNPDQAVILQLMSPLELAARRAPILTQITNPKYPNVRTIGGLYEVKDIFTQPHPAAVTAETLAKPIGDIQGGLKTVMVGGPRNQQGEVSDVAPEVHHFEPTQTAGARSSTSQPEGAIEVEKPTVMFIYRQNAAYDSLVPLMVEALTAQGRKVEVISFRKEAPQQGIEKWLKANAAQANAKTVFADQTCSSNELQASWITIDHLSQSVLRKALRNEPWFADAELAEWGTEKEDEQERYYRSLTASLTEAMRQLGTPSEVIVWPSKLSNHVLPRGEKDAQIPRIECPENRKDQDAMRAWKEREAVRDLAIAEDARDAIVGTGFPKEKIKIVVDRTAIRQECDSHSGQSIWVLYDRHADEPLLRTPGVIQIPLPLDSTLSMMIKRGMIHADAKHLPAAAQTVMVNKLMEQEEKKK